MMKRIISILICVLMLAGMLSVSATETETNYKSVKVEYKRADSTITVSGTVKSAIDANECVRLMLLKPDCDIEKLTNGEISFVSWAVYADETAMANKTFAFKTFKISETLTPGDYILRIAFENEVYTKIIPVATIAQTVTAIKNATNVDGVKKCIADYNDVYGLDNDNNSIFGKFSADNKNYVYSKMIGVSYETKADVYKQFTNYTSLKKVALGPWGEVATLLSENATLLGLDMSIYNTLSSNKKDLVCKALTGNSYATPEALNTALQKLSKNPPEATTGPIGGGGGGGGAAAPSKDAEETSTISWAGENVNVPDANDKEEVAFTDLGNHQWAVESINKLYAKGIVNGKADGIFAPEDNLTRAEAIKLIVLAFGGVDQEADCNFTDVDKNSWMFTYIATAAKRGIVNGYEDGTFGVNNIITREDLSVMIARAADAAEVTLYGKNIEISFTDANDVADYAKAAVKKLQMAGIINGMEDNTFMPKLPATRAQAAKIIAGLV